MDASKEEKNKPKETGSSRNMQEKEKVPQNHFLWANLMDEF